MRRVKAQIVASLKLRHSAAISYVLYLNKSPPRINYHRNRVNVAPLSSREGSSETMSSRDDASRLLPSASKRHAIVITKRLLRPYKLRCGESPSRRHPNAPALFAIGGGERPQMRQIGAIFGLAERKLVRLDYLALAARRGPSLALARNDGGIRSRPINGYFSIREAHSRRNKYNKQPLISPIIALKK